MESEFLRGERWQFYFLNSPNNGSKSFLREGELRNSMRIKFVYLGRGRKPMVARPNMHI